MSSTEPSAINVFFTTLLSRLNTGPSERYVDGFDLTGDEWVLDYGSDWGRLSQPIAEIEFIPLIGNYPRIYHSSRHICCFFERGDDVVTFIEC